MTRRDSAFPMGLSVSLLLLFSFSGAFGFTSSSYRQAGDAAEILIGPGIVIEKVVPDAAAEKAGLHEGDILLSWSRGNSKGEFQSPFDLAVVETEEGPQGKVTLGGWRGTEKSAWLLGYRPWQVEVRPNFSRPAVVRLW